jgi:hypothetical protein
VIRLPGDEDDSDPGEHRFAIIVAENNNAEQKNAGSQ